MCLIDKRIVRYADHNIPIFKVAIKKGDKYYSPYQNDNRLWRVNTTDFTIYQSICVQGCTLFAKGYFFAFDNFGDALSRASYNPDLVILKGYIPEGTRFAYENGEICSHKMILNI